MVVGNPLGAELDTAIDKAFCTLEFPLEFKLKVLVLGGRR